MALAGALAGALPFVEGGGLKAGGEDDGRSSRSGVANGDDARASHGRDGLSARLPRVRGHSCRPWSRAGQRYTTAEIFGPS